MHLFGKTARLVLGVVLVGSGLLGVDATPAAACSIANDDHCYGVAVTVPSSIIGVEAVLAPNCLSTPASNFITDEMWLGASGGTYWVEVGYLQLGAGVHINGIPAAGRYAFWGDRKPGGGFHDHVLHANPALAGGHYVGIYKSAPNTYYVDFGSYSSHSTSNTMAPSYGVFGSETTSATGRSWGDGGSADYLTGGGRWAELVHTQITHQAPERFSWVDEPTSYHAGAPCN